MSNPLDRRLGKRDGLRYTITWLHRRAESMNDPQAKAILNSAAFSLGNEIREGRIPSIKDGDDGAEKMRALDEAVIKAARDLTGPYEDTRAISGNLWTALRDALAARDAALADGEEK